MGFEKLNKKREELRKKEDALNAFIAVAEKLHAAADKMQKTEAELTKALADLHDKKFKLRPVVENLDTLQIKEFEQIKANLVAICTHQTFRERVLPLGPAKKVVENYRKDYYKDLYAWLDKLKTSMPKVFKKGMKFHDYEKNRIYEMVADEQPIADKDLLPGQRYGSIMLHTKYIDLTMESPIEIDHKVLKENFPVQKVKCIKL
jgi:hypothetical protein